MTTMKKKEQKKLSTLVSSWLLEKECQHHFPSELWEKIVCPHEDICSEI